MKKNISRLLTLVFGIVVGTLPPPAFPDDIDLFVGAPTIATNNPNILIVLDNTSNWSAANQHFPGSPTEGQGEVTAIKTALAALGSSAANINVGLMEFSTKQSPGGQITYAIRPMSTTNLTNFSNILTDASYSIYNNITDPGYKLASNVQYGDLMRDAYNYFMGNAPIYPSAVVTTPNPGRFDPAGYTDSTYTRFKAPNLGTGCNHNFIIFIGNVGGGNDPIADTTANTTALNALGGIPSPRPSVPQFAAGAVYTNLGYSSQCYTANSAGVSSCSSTELTGGYATQCAAYSGYNGSAACQCNGSDSTAALAACPSGTQRYTVVGSNNSSTTTTTTQTSTATGTSACYTSSSGPSGAGDHGGLTCPANTDTGVGSNPRVITTYSCSYAYGTTGGGSCPATAGTPSSSSSTQAVVPTTAPSTACYTSASTCSSAGEKGGMTCPSSTSLSPASCSSYPCTQTQTTHSCAYSCGAATGTACTTAGSGSTTSAQVCSATTSKNAISTTAAAADSNKPACPGASFTNTATRTYNCSASTYTVTGTSCSGSGNNKHWYFTRTVPYSDVASSKYTVTQQDTPTLVTTTTPAVANYTYGVTQTITKTVQTTTTTSGTTTLGNTSACYSSLSACSTSDYSSVAGNYSGGLSCNAPSTTTGSCPLSGLTYQVQGIFTGVAPTTTLAASIGKNSPINSPLWAQYMNQNNIASTFAIDVYHDQPQAAGSTMLNAMARLGGGRYYTATSASAITSALTKILNQIQSVNSTFASAALPVNATNRAQNQNQVFIGMFRPDPQAQPRWYGNVKQYQLINTGSAIELGDSLGVSAVNLQTGFINNCAVSYWSNDSGTYWVNVPSDTFGNGQCSPNTFSPWSDAPDGPLVEKGGASEIQRQGNNPAATPTYQVDSNRNVITLAGTSMVTFNATNASSLSSTLVSYMQGKDVPSPSTSENSTTTGGTAATATRPSIHGDVIHSRPLPLNYGTTYGVVTYYGANDGTLRAVNAANGKELWAFVAPEFFPRFSRLLANSPAVKFPNSTDPAATAKDYFFDGSIGVYQNTDNSKVWIYPTMRRGGRMIYSFDVTTPSTPTFKWKVGCPDLTDDTGCSTGFTGIGQTWSQPNVAFVKGFSTTTPIIVVGGGYDSCEDANTGTPSCSSPKGNAVYVLNADTGAVLGTFPTTRSVAADISLVDVDSDGSIDYAYAADTGGNIYRLSFVNSSSVSQAPSGWSMTRVAYTSGANRKFLFGPGIVPVRGSYVYLAIGTGDREHPLSSEYPYPGGLSTTDPGVVNRFYLFIDNLASSTVLNLDDATKMQNAASVGCDASTFVYPNGSKSGWYLNLNQYGAGEQVVTSAVIAAGLVTFNTNRPTPPTPGTCSNLGEARGYLVDLFNGSGAIGVPGACGGQISNTFVGGGLPPSPVLATVPISGTSKTVLIGAVQKDGSTSTILQSQQIQPTINLNRRQIYWKKSGDN